jgi:hypothetical protein
MYWYKQVNHQLLPSTDNYSVTPTLHGRERTLSHKYLQGNTISLPLETTISTTTAIQLNKNNQSKTFQVNT